MLNKNMSRSEIIKWNNKMLVKTKAQSYLRGIILTKINLAIQYYNLGKPDISLKYLTDADNLLKTIPKDLALQTKLEQEFSQVYYTMGLFKVALNYNTKAMLLAEKLKKNIHNLKLLNYVYTSRSNTLSALKKDSSLYYLHKAIYHYKNPNSFICLANNYIENKTHLDSAKYYLEHSENILKNIKYKNNYSLSVLFYTYGNLFITEKKYTKAINYLEKSLSLAANEKNRQHLLNIYNALANAYTKTGNLDKEKKNLEDYKKFNESYSNSYTKGIETILLNTKTEEKNHNKNYTLINTAIFILFILSIFAIYYFYKRKINKIKIQQIEELSKIKKIETHESVLEKMPQVTIDLVYKSAKERDPNFFTKFQTLYPNFVKKLINISPTLQNNEIQLLMYIFLKFETKEIANLLCLSPKTIQNRKYTIRKKLKISTSTDIYIWLVSNFQ